MSTINDEHARPDDAPRLQRAARHWREASTHDRRAFVRSFSRVCLVLDNEERAQIRDMLEALALGVDDHAFEGT